MGTINERDFDLSISFAKKSTKYQMESKEKREKNEEGVEWARSTKVRRKRRANQSFPSTIKIKTKSD